LEGGIFFKKELAIRTDSDNTPSVMKTYPQPFTLFLPETGKTYTNGKVTIRLKFYEAYAFRDSDNMQEIKEYISEDGFNYYRFNENWQEIAV